MQLIILEINQPARQTGQTRWFRDPPTRSYFPSHRAYTPSTHFEFFPDFLVWQPRPGCQVQGEERNKDATRLTA